MKRPSYHPAYRKGYAAGQRRKQQRHLLEIETLEKQVTLLQVQLRDLRTKRAQEYTKFCPACQRVVQDLSPIVEQILEELTRT